MKAWLKPIDKLGACKEAVEWGEQFETIDEAWSKCEHGEWMLWLLGKLAGSPKTESRRKLVLTACQCARLLLYRVPEGELRPLQAIETTERWARKEKGITLGMVKIAADAAAYAAEELATQSFLYRYALYLESELDAAYAAADAADAASLGGYAAAYGVEAKRCADIVRENYPAPPVLWGKK